MPATHSLLPPPHVSSFVFHRRRAQQLISVRVLSSNKDIGKLIGENGRDIAAIREQCEAMLHISGARDGSQSWHQAMHAIFAILLVSMEAKKNAQVFMLLHSKSTRGIRVSQPYFHAP